MKIGPVATRGKVSQFTGKKARLFCTHSRECGGETGLQRVVYPVFVSEHAILLDKNGPEGQLAGRVLAAVRQIQLENQTGPNESPRALAACSKRWRSQHLHATDRRFGAAAA